MQNILQTFQGFLTRDNVGNMKQTLTLDFLWEINPKLAYGYFFCNFLAQISIITLVWLPRLKMKLFVETLCQKNYLSEIFRCID